jgi:4'-phosphopantetheinyl transferase EntD
VTDPLAVEHLLVELAPEGAGVAACRVDEASVETLREGERALVEAAREVRRVEFAAGRACAHRALAAIGVEASAIGCGARRQPLWPEGVTGSISHSAGLAVAVVTVCRPAVASLGVDLEGAASLDEELWPHVLSSSEQDHVRASGDPGLAVGLFSAKEAAFKAFYPLLGVEIDFLEACVVLEADVSAVDVPGLGRRADIRQGRAGSVVVSVATVA